MVRDEASGPAGRQPPQQQHGRTQPSRAGVRQPDRQAGHGADGRRDGVQAQLDRSDARRQDRQSGTETLDGDGLSEEDEGARPPRTVDEALDTAETMIRAVGQLASVGLHGDAWARVTIAQAEDEVRDLLHLMDTTRDCGGFGVPGTLGKSDSRFDGGALGSMQSAALRSVARLVPAVVKRGSRSDD